MVDDRKYKTYAETFRVSSFSLAINMMYPNQRNEKRRLLIVGAMLLTFMPAAALFAFDLYESFLRRDVDNITRQITLAIPFVMIAVKMVIANYKRKVFELVLDEVDEDLVAANNLSEDFQKIVDIQIKSGFAGQTVWTTASLMVTGIFPTMATVLMVYQNLKSNEVKRYMIHDVAIPYIGDQKYETPYFQIVFAYMLFLCLFFIFNFTGFDGTFCICVNHGALKLKLLARRLKNIFQKMNELDLIKIEIRKIVCDHQKIIIYLNNLQNLYGIWLAAVFILSLVQICMTMYQLTESKGIDPKYMIFVVGSVNHIYIPCHFSAALKQTADDLSTDIYCCGWERHSSDQWITNAVQFMIMRSQKPVLLTAMGMVTFDMLLFVSMLQSSYSMYTLLTSK